MKQYRDIALTTFAIAHHASAQQQLRGSSSLPIPSLSVDDTHAGHPRERLLKACPNDERQAACERVGGFMKLKFSGKQCTETLERNGQQFGEEWNCSSGFGAVQGNSFRVTVLGVDTETESAHTYYSNDGVSVGEELTFSCGDMPEFNKGECRDLQVIVAKKESDGYLPVQVIEFKAEGLQEDEEFGSIQVMETMCPCVQDLPQYSVTFSF